MLVLNRLLVFLVLLFILPNAEAGIFLPRMRARIQMRRQVFQARFVAQAPIQRVSHSDEPEVSAQPRAERAAQTPLTKQAETSRPVDDSPRAVEPKKWQGVPIPRDGGAKPKLSDSAFNGKSCRTRDKTVREPEDVKNGDAEDYYDLHPDFKADVRPKGAKGVEVVAQKGRYNIIFSSDQSKGGNVWQGDAQFKLDLTGVRFPAGTPKPKTDFTGPFKLDISNGVHTLTFRTNREEGTTAFIPPADILENVTQETYTKISSDGNEIEFSLTKDSTGKLVGFQVYSICGDAYGDKELNPGDDMQKITPATQKVLEKLLGSISDQ